MIVKTTALEDVHFPLEDGCFWLRNCEKILRTVEKMRRPPKEKGPQCGGLSCSWALALALQQAQHTLLGGIRLCQHRHRGLLEDLRLGEVGAFCREVGVLNARTTRL